MYAAYDNQRRILLHSLWIVWLLCWPCWCTGDELAVDNPYKVEAAFLRNFAHYVSWPENNPAQDKENWRICVLGPDPFGKVLDETLSGRQEQGRGFSILRGDDVEELKQCHILFIGYKDAVRRRAALQQLKHHPVLSVGEAPDFLREGGVIGFRVSDRVRMNVNLDQARAVSLLIQTRMLEVASEVLENGATRKLR